MLCYYREIKPNNSLPTWTQSFLKMVCQFIHLKPTFTGKPSHDDCMSGLGLRKACDRYIGIPNSLHLEYFTALGNLVKGLINLYCT